MPTTALLLDQPDSFATLRAFHRIRLAGFRLIVEGGKLAVEAKTKPLTAEQRRFIHSCKTALVALLEDVATLTALLATAGRTGIAEGEPPGWDWERRYTALDVLISQGNARFVLGRYYLAECAPVDWEECKALPQADGQRITPLSALVELSKSRTRQEFEEGLAKKRGGR